MKPKPFVLSFYNRSITKLGANSAEVSSTKWKNFAIKLFKVLNTP